MCGGSLWMTSQWRDVFSWGYLALCCIVNAWSPLIVALFVVHVIPFNYLLLSPLFVRVSADLLLVPQLPFLVGRNLPRRDGGFQSLFVALHDALISSCWLWTQLYFPLFQMCSVVIFWHKAALVFLRVIRQSVNSEASRESCGKSNMWRGTDGLKEHWWIDEHAGIKRIVKIWQKQVECHGTDTFWGWKWCTKMGAELQGGGSEKNGDDHGRLGGK